MKRFIIGALVCLNLALVAGVVFNARAGKAYAQRRGSADYVMITARRSTREEVLFVIDTSRRLMLGFWADTTKKDMRLVTLGPRNIERDFPIRGR